MSSEMPKGSEKKIQYSISMALTQLSISLNLNPMVKVISSKNDVSYLYEKAVNFIMKIAIGGCS